MSMKKISEAILGVGVDDTTIDLFESQYPVPTGVSYNSYVILDEKTTILDTVDARATEPWLENLAEALGDCKPAYLVVSHMEPDHGANVAKLAALYPEMQVVGNAKTFQYMEQFFGAEAIAKERRVVVKDGESLSLGAHTLTFVFAPMVHWPEVMVTYEESEKLLFSADAFGRFGALSLTEKAPWAPQARRYYLNIVGKYGAPVQKALQKLSGLPIETICSTHGPVWQQEIGRVIGIYDQLSRYEGEPGVVIAYGSMYGNTAQMAEKIARELTVQGVKNIIVYNLSYADISNVIRDIFKYDTLIVGSPTYNGELFPEVGSLLQKISERCIPCRKFAYFGSYTWAGAAVRLLGEFAQKMKWEAICQPTEMKQGYDDQGAQCCTALAKAIAEKIR